MIVAIMTVDLYLLGAASLKEKRSVLRRLKDRMRQKFNISIAEVDYQDKWQRAQLGISQVGNDYKYLEKCMNTIFNALDNFEGVEVIDHVVEYL